MWKRRLAIATVLFTVFLFVLIQTASFQQWLLRRIQGFATTANFPFKADKLRLNIFEMQAALDGFVYDKDGTRVRVNHVTIDMPWNGLFGDSIVVNSVSADGVSVSIQSAEPVVPEPSGETKSSPKLQIGRLAIHNVDLTYSNQNMLVRIPSFNIDATDGRGAIRMTAPITISPDTQIALQQIPVMLNTESAQFGPLQWSLQYAGYEGAGSADGDVKWSPSVAFHLNFTTQPMTIEKWKDIQASGKAGYDDGKLKLADVRIVQGSGEETGQLIANAEISDKEKTAALIWSGLRIDPIGVRGKTDGTANIGWKASDFSDLNGVVALNVNTPQYGKARGDIHLADGKANADLQATAMDASIRAKLVAGMDHTLGGTFNVSHRKYGLVDVNGKLGGTFEKPTADAALSVRNASYNGIGPLNASANAAVRGQVVTVNNVRAQLKNSTIPDGSLRINLANKELRGSIPQIQVNANDFAPDVRGTAELSATLSGTTDRPAAQFDGVSNGLDIGGTHIDSANVSGRFANNTLVVNRLTARQGEGGLDASASVNLATRSVAADARIANLKIVQVRDLSTTVNLDARISGTTVSPVAEFNGRLDDIVYQGLNHGNIALEGSTTNTLASVRATSDKYNAVADARARLETPFAFDATLTMKQSHIEYDRYDLSASGAASLSGQAQPFEAHEVSFNNFSVAGNGVHLTVDGNMNSGTKVDATANLAELPVDAATLTGSAEIHATLRGDIRNPAIDGSVATRNATAKTPQMSEPVAVQAAVDFNRNEFSIRQLQAQISDAMVTVAGAGTLKGTGRFQFDASNVHPQNFARDRPISGTIGVTGRLNVDAPNIQSISGDATVTQLELSLREIPIRQVRPIQVAIENQVFSIRNFQLEGADTQATIGGSANLQTRTLNFDLDAKTNLQILEPFIADSAVEGQVETKLALRGTTDKPDLNGFINIANTQIQTVKPPLILSDLGAEIRFSGDRMDIARASGKLNEGALAASGGAGLSASGLRDSTVRLTLSKAQLEYPEGLQSEISSDIRVTGSSPALVAQGDVNIENAIYVKDIDLTQEIFRRITADKDDTIVSGAPRKAPAAADQLRLELQVKTVGPISVDNNMASLDMNGEFQVRGTISDPVILGRAAVEEGGEIYFGAGVAASNSVADERRDRYVIERGVITFNNPLLTEPELDFEATHEIDKSDERYVITLRATGTPAKLRTEFTSDPALDERDIQAMLLTGRTYTELQQSVLAVGQENLASYFSGQVSGFFEGAGSALGLDTVRIEPVAIAGETDLGARLTLGKDITRNLGLIYSQSLAGARSETWIASYRPWRSLLARAVNDTENKEFRLEINHDLRIGGGPALPRRITPRNESVYGDVTFVTQLDTKALLKKVNKPGSPFNISRMNDDVKDLKKFLAKQSMLRARVRAQRNPHDGKVDVQFTVEEGPKITLAYQGAKVSGGVQDDVRQLWMVSLTDGSALQASDSRLLRHMRDEGFLQARVTHTATSPSPAERRITFNIEPGRKFKDPNWLFKGIDEKEQKAIEVPDKAGLVLENPETIRQKIDFDFQKKGFLDAKSTAPELIFQEDGPKFVVNIEKGRQYMVNRIEFTGLSFMDKGRLTNALREGPTKQTRLEEAGRPPQVEEELPLFPFTNDWIAKAQQRVTAEYWGEGFNDVEITASTATDREKGQIAVQFSVNEGQRQMIESVRVEGANLTDMSHVNRYLDIKEGDPVDFTRVNLTRKKLYDTSLFKRVDIQMVKGQTASGYVAQINLNESAPWRLRYGFAVGRATESSGNDLGVKTDFSYGNLFGKGLLAGAAVTETRGFREARIYGSLPVFLNREIKTTLAAYQTHDLRDRFQTDDIKAVTLQQQRRLKNYYILQYDYTYRWEHVFDRDLTDDTIVPDSLTKLSGFNGTLSRDTRDDILNATRGSFFSNSFELAPPWLGSEVRFVRNYAQYFHFKALSRNRVWANAVRVGAAKAFSGDKLVPSTQFRGGGGTTLRAFKQDELTLSAGNALLVVNTELRTPLFGRFGGVAFFDIGNVYENIGGLKSFKLRYSPGIGLRIKTPFILLRVDMGLNLWPRTGEDRRRWVFGVGQAF
jgi:outer membrane protein assembly factor BamA/autotransporter translocation and assembly factor TamB